MNDLEKDWDAIVSAPALVQASDKVTDLDGFISLVAEEAMADLKKQHPMWEESNPSLSQVQEAYAQAFRSCFCSRLRHQDATGLLEFILEGPGDLTPAEIVGFLGALPEKLLARVLESPVGTATGTHALLAFEVHRRAGLVSYELTRDIDGRIVGTVRSNSNKHEPLTFVLRDEFSLEQAEKDGAALAQSEHEGLAQGGEPGILVLLGGSP